MAIHSSMRGLRCFCVAADCLSFKETARQLYLTPSAVSHQIKQLESELGLDLFLRQTRSVELTPHGKAFYQALLPLMRELEQTLRTFAPVAAKFFSDKSSKQTQPMPKRGIDALVVDLNQDQKEDLVLPFTQQEQSVELTNQLQLLLQQ